MTAAPTPPQQFNALKHGLHSAAMLLPGDDPAAYERQRRALYRTYRPQTEDEAEAVESLAEFRWLRARCREVMARFDAQALAPETDAAGRIGEPLAHRRLHSSMDVLKHRQRAERLWHRAGARLAELQRLRRLGLVAGARNLPADCYMDVSGAVFGPVPTSEVSPVPEPAQATAPPPARQPDTAPVTASSNEESRKNAEQQETPAAPGGMVSPLQFQRRRLKGRPRGQLVGGFGARRIFAAEVQALTAPAEDALP